VNRPARLVVVALTASTALLLTACGSGGGDDSSSDKIKGAGAGGEKDSASASAPASPGSAERPKITLSKEFQANFEGWTNSDPKLQAILNDGREELRSEYAAVIEADLNSDAVAFYNSDATLTTARKWIKQFVDDDESLIGSVRAFDPQVHINDTGSGVLFYCVDERKASTKNRRTAKITTTADKPENVIQYRNKLDKNPQGVWKTTSSTVVPGACG
jgi:Asp-tRNA(Asn)/Glu-tRNA(Gln) amidotransferase A subunit family amidase